MVTLQCSPRDFTPHAHARAGDYMIGTGVHIDTYKLG